MKVEFTHAEVVLFLKMYSLFKETLDDRVQILLATGDIEDELADEAKKQKYNEVILENINLSVLIRNLHLEQLVKSITGNDISIIDHSDDSISGTACEACDYIVFESEEDAFYEICPVCGWQNDGSKGSNKYSSANCMTISEYRDSESFKKNIADKIQIYKKLTI